MRPGGRFLLIGWCKQQGLSAIQEELVLHPFMRYWGIPSLETPEGYERYFVQNGFRLLALEDLNAQVKRNWEFGYEQAIKVIQTVSVSKAARLVWKGMSLGRDGIQLIKEQFPAALYIKAGFDAGFLRYTYVLGERV